MQLVPNALIKEFEENVVKYEYDLRLAFLFNQLISFSLVPSETWNFYLRERCTTDALFETQRKIHKSKDVINSQDFEI